MAKTWVLYLVILLYYSKWRSTTNADRVIGGYRCSVQSIPYIVSVREYKNSKHCCGGTILSELWILSAAHCCVKCVNITVVVGQSTISNDTGSEYPRKVVESVVHKNPEDNDICLLKLDKPLIKSRDVQFVKLPTEQLNNSYLEEFCKEVLVAGWGVQYPKDIKDKPAVTIIPPHDSYLQCVKLNIFNTERCKKRFPFYIAPSIICALTKGKDSCSGDSGGPLVCQGIQYGLTSAGVACAHHHLPGMYTRIDMYLDFIHSNVFKSPKQGKVVRSSGFSKKSYGVYSLEFILCLVAVIISQ